MQNKVVDRDTWLKAQAEFVKKEKEFTRARDQLARERREQPWTLVEKSYVFEGPDGKKSFADLFEGRRQLHLQHFMMGPGWKEGCPGCSFQADHVDGALPHLHAKDVTYVAVSRAPYADIAAYKRRMGWKFPWYSSNGTDFNMDFGVSFPGKKKGDKIFYNYGTEDFEVEELPGNSAFYKNDEGQIFRTYSSYARGCEQLIGTYMYLDLAPLGRNEDGFKEHPMEWMKRHDEYASKTDKPKCH